MNSGWGRARSVGTSPNKTTEGLTYWVTDKTPLNVIGNWTKVSASSFAAQLKAAADAFGKSPRKIPELFLNFIRYNVDAVHNEEGFLNGFLRHFEALVGFGTQFSPELDDESYADSPLPIQTISGPRSVSRFSSAPSRDEPDRASAPNAFGDVWEGPGQCPKCHAPQGKRHGKPCMS